MIGEENRTMPCCSRRDTTVRQNRRARGSIGRLILIGVALLIMLQPAGAASPLSGDTRPIKQALNYLKTNHLDDGGFGSGGTTEWVIMAIASAGQDPRQWQREGHSPLDYLGTLSPTSNPFDWIRMTLALTAMGEEPRDFHGVDYLQMIKGHYKGGQFGDPLSLRDDYWAVLALVSAGEKSSKEVQDSQGFILTHQNPDGSWSASTTGIETCADNTAGALVALMASGYKPETEAVRKALTYLKGVQGHDGGFSYLFMPSNSASDAWVIQALWAVGEDPSGWRQRHGDLIGHLLTLQQSDGSFKWTADAANSPLLMTAYAVPALLGKPYPISPSQSNLITVTVRIEGERHTLLHTPVTLGPTRFEDAQGTGYTASFPTPLSLVVEAVRDAAIPYQIQSAALGLYLKSLGGESGGWQYRVNHGLPMVSAHRYRLKSSDEVIWFYDYQGCKSPLRIIPEQVRAWEGERIRFLVEQFDDTDHQWKRASGVTVTAGTHSLPAPHGEVSIPFEHAGMFRVFADKDQAIRSVSTPIVIEKPRSVTVNLRIQDTGTLLCDQTLSLFPCTTTDITGRSLSIRKPVVLGALEAARRKELITYEVIQTAEGVILVSINGRAEDNEHGSWWYEVNGIKVIDDIDEYELTDHDIVVFYRSRHPRG